MYFFIFRIRIVKFAPFLLFLGCVSPPSETQYEVAQASKAYLVRAYFDEKEDQSNYMGFCENVSGENCDLVLDYELYKGESMTVDGWPAVTILADGRRIPAEEFNPGKSYGSPQLYYVFSVLLDSGELFYWKTDNVAPMAVLFHDGLSPLVEL